MSRQTRNEYEKNSPIYLYHFFISLKLTLREIILINHHISAEPALAAVSLAALQFALDVGFPPPNLPPNLPHNLPPIPLYTASGNAPPAAARLPPSPPPNTLGVPSAPAHTLRCSAPQETPPPSPASPPAILLTSANAHRFPPPQAYTQTHRELIHCAERSPVTARSTLSKPSVFLAPFTETIPLTCPPFKVIQFFFGALKNFVYSLLHYASSPSSSSSSYGSNVSVASFHCPICSCVT